MSSDMKSSDLPPWLQTRCRRYGPWSLTLAAITTLVLFRWLWTMTPPEFHDLLPILQTSTHVCPNSSLAEDILVVLKTGATEAHQKLPIHFSTTFRCTPNFLIYSDLEETIDGHHIYDTLDEVSDSIKNNDDDFALYRELQAARGDQEKLRALEKHADTKLAWNLDKWKFLPLMEKAFKMQPESKWFVFIEADTHLVWSNLLRYLPRFDPSNPHYIGCEAYIGNNGFGHGGSGVILSNAALKRLVEYRASRIEHYNDLTDREWAGDLVLALALHDVDVNLLQTWPILQGETPASLDYIAPNYCSPVVSYHHMSAMEIEEMWNFEQDWMQEQEAALPIRHRDVFERLIQPKITDLRENWDNLSNDWTEELETKSLESCLAACTRRKDCVQYSWEQNESTCRTAKVIRFGKEKDQWKSGWIIDRVKEFQSRMEPCPPPHWKLQN